MLKVLTLESDAWDLGVGKTEDEDKPKQDGNFVYESSLLNMFLNDGWNIRDFKMTQSEKYYRTWTFILEK